MTTSRTAKKAAAAPAAKKAAAAPAKPDDQVENDQVENDRFAVVETQDGDLVGDGQNLATLHAGDDFARVSVSVEPAVTVEAADHAKAEKRRLNKEAHERAAALRAQEVGGLRNELAYLERQPKPNQKRIAQVNAQLDRYSDEPADAEIEKA